MLMNESIHDGRGAMTREVGKLVLYAGTVAMDVQTKCRFSSLVHSL